MAAKDDNCLQTDNQEAGLLGKLMRRMLPRETSIGELPLYKWELDFPSTHRDAWIEASGRMVQGWVLLPEALSESASRLRVVAEWQPDYELSHPLEIKRPDVIEAVLNERPQGHSQLCCGFRFTVPHRLRHFRLWLVLDDNRLLLKDVRIADAEIEAPTVLKVLAGKSGWLFLNNDTNASVDQYRGRIQLTEQGLSGWQRYLKGVQQLADTRGLAWAMLVAPSKESVMGPRYHPLPAGQGGPMSQLLGLPEASRIVWPVAQLQALGDNAYIQTDTHWTHRGAQAAATALASHLGVAEAVFGKRLIKDRYQRRQIGGDLGNKLTPRQACEVEVLTSFSYQKYKRYDNGLPNFGRLVVMEYPNALLEGTCLLFGSSSSYSMFNYLCRLFRRLVFVHSAGNLDPSVVDSVHPDYLVIQTNARFVVQVPLLNQPLDDTIRDKADRLSKDELAQVATRRIDADEDTLAAWGLSPWAMTEIGHQ